MPEQVETERLAGAISMLRPDWPAGSVKRFILGRQELAARPMRDLTLALVAVALDPASTSPARVLEAGPWWQLLRGTTQATTPDVGPGRGVPRCQAAGHEHEPAHACRACRAEQIAQPDREETP